VPTKWAALANQICQLPLFDCKVEKILTTYYVRKTKKQTNKKTHSSASLQAMITAILHFINLSIPG